jgi:putative heme-binding domain-containing protein
MSKRTQLFKGLLIVLLSAMTQAARGADAATAADPDVAPTPNWIWAPSKAKDGDEQYFRATFDCKLPINDAWLWAACDDQMTIYLNGQTLTKHDGWTDAVLEDVRKLLVDGENVLAVRCRNDTQFAGLAMKLQIRGAAGAPITLITDEHWTCGPQRIDGWRDKGFSNASFVKARVIGNYGIGPWGKIKAPPPGKATRAQDLVLLPGFKAELIYTVPKGTQGSWVSMTPDPHGRLYVSDQNGSLFRVTPPQRDGATTQPAIERIDLDIGSAQGMTWAFDSLYVMVNSTNTAYASGLYRLRDTNGDDKLDQITCLKTFLDRTRDSPAAGEHGPHAVVLGPDNMLYVVGGNSTELPEDVAPTSPARHFSEDLLNERMTDPKGLDPNIYAPGAWVCRTDADGKLFETYAVGLRNPYDIAFAPNGELLTFDSDMEWDVGTPWYRPIRICHVVSGAEFGWRNGSAKWPTYYADSLPPVIDVGLGSPTGVTFGTGAKFPAKYQRALFASDWAYGKLYAVHLTPDGASYKAQYELFLTGKPYAITDIVINHDGAMYLIIGGRGTQSGLYRVTYVGDESTAPAPPLEDPPAAVEARALRHKLESFHNRRDPRAIDFAWPHLASSDRFIRYAARVAVENQDPALWMEKALHEPEPAIVSNALIALCRVANASLQPRVLDALAKFELAKLPRQQLLDVLRAYELCFIRLGRPFDPAAAQGVASRLDALYPANDDEINHELCQLLVHLKSPGVIAKSLALLAKAQRQEEQLFYTFNLRTVRDGWTLPEREAYFNWMNRAQESYVGGASYKQFVANTRAQVIATLSEKEQAALASVIKPPVDLDAPGPQPPPRQFVHSWTIEELTPRLAQLKSGRSFQSGKAAFEAVSCTRCHRFNGVGGASGPDITGVGNRFQPADLLESIVLPSKVISDQYQATEIVTKQNQVVVGTVQEENDQQVVLRASPLYPATETVLKKDIKVRRPSKVSIMPQGLLDVLKEDEVLDLLAYLRAAGNPHDPAFEQSSASATAPPPHEQR